MQRGGRRRQGGCQCLRNSQEGGGGAATLRDAPVLPKPTFLTKSMLMRYLLAARNGCALP